MQYSLLIILVVAHILSDFVLQNQKLIDHKREAGAKSFLWIGIHCLVVFVLTWLAAWSWRFFGWALLIAGTHFLIDCTRSWLERSGMLVKWGMLLFVVDQFLHISIICLVAYFASENSWFDWSADLKMNGVLDLRLLAIAAVICTKPANIAIRNQLRIVGRDVNSGAGFLIGSCERILVLFLALFGEYTAIAILFAAKALLLKSENSKPEHILAGSLMSFAIAIFCGVLLKATL